MVIRSHTFAFFYGYGDDAGLHSFPTRRSSDLGLRLMVDSAPDLTVVAEAATGRQAVRDRKSTRLNSSHANSSYAVFCLKKKTSALDRTCRVLRNNPKALEPQPQVLKTVQPRRW